MIINILVMNGRKYIAFKIRISSNVRWFLKPEWWFSDLSTCMPASPTLKFPKRCTNLVLHASKYGCKKLWFLRGKICQWIFLKLSLDVTYQVIEGIWWANLTTFILVLVLIIWVVHRSMLHFTVAGRTVY